MSQIVRIENGIVNTEISSEVDLAKALVIFIKAYFEFSKIRN